MAVLAVVGTWAEERVKDRDSWMRESGDIQFRIDSTGASSGLRPMTNKRVSDASSGLRPMANRRVSDRCQ